WLLVSPGTRFEATDSKATNRPSGLTTGLSTLLLLPFASVPELSTLTRSVAPTIDNDDQAVVEPVKATRMNDIAVIVATAATLAGLMPDSTDSARTCSFTS